MRSQTAKNKGFTVMELMVVVAIILVLAAGAISGSRGIIRDLRLQNYFSRIVFMVQEARSLAKTGKDKDATDYSVRFDMPEKTNKVTMIKTKSDGTTFDEEIFNFDEAIKLKLISTPACASTIVIGFSAGDAETSITCDNADKSSIKIGIEENIPNGKSKTFSIHKIAGIPQTSK